MVESWKYVRQKLERLRSEEFTPINDVLSYGIDADVVHIHAEQQDSLGLVKKLHLFREGLGGLAQIIKEHPEVSTITATSWIIAENPELIKKFGFTVDGPIDQKTRDAFFPGETRPISAAHISATDFLHIYLKESSETP